jgi:hypothetical protein
MSALFFCPEFFDPVFSASMDLILADSILGGAVASALR